MLEVVFVVLAALVVLLFLPFFIEFVLPLAILAILLGLFSPLLGMLVFGGGMALAILWLVMFGLLGG